MYLLSPLLYGPYSMVLKNILVVRFFSQSINMKNLIYWLLFHDIYLMPPIGSKLSWFMTKHVLPCCVFWWHGRTDTEILSLHEAQVSPWLPPYWVNFLFAVIYWLRVFIRSVSVRVLLKTCQIFNVGEIKLKRNSKIKLIIHAIVAAYKGSK